MERPKKGAGNRVRLIHHAIQCAFPLAAIAAGAPAFGLTINLAYDSSVTSNPNAAAIENATQYVATQYANLFSDPISININVVASSSPGLLGESSTQLVTNVVNSQQVPYTYSDVRNALVNDRASTSLDDSTALSDDLPAADPTGGAGIVVPRAEAKAIGLNSSDAANDGTFTFGTGFDYTFDPTNRAVPGKMDFVGVAEHEISEIMGRIPSLGTVRNIGGTNIATLVPYDLMRFTAVNSRGLNQTDTNAYFSIDGGTTPLKNYNPAGNGGDLSDWASGSNDAYNAFSGSGGANHISAVDTTVMDVIGYNPTILNWNGQADQTTWDIFKTANWGNGNGNTTYTDSTRVIIGAPFLQPITVNLVATVRPMSVQVSGGDIGTLTISGTGSISGPTSLSAPELGKVILATNNAYTGGTIVTLGTLQVGNGGTAGSLGTGTVTLGRGAALVFDRRDSFSLANTITGGGSLTQSGSGNMTLTATNTYSLGTTVLAGTLTIGAAGAIPAGSSISNNASLVVAADTTSGAISGTGTTTVASGTTLSAWGGLTQAALLNDGAVDISGLGGIGNARITGAGTLTIHPNCTVFLKGPSTQSMLTIDFGGELDISGNSFDIHYGAHATPDGTIRGYLIEGYNGGSWVSPTGGIISFSAHNDTLHHAVGYADGADNVVAGLASGDELIKYTFAGDANLDGKVDVADLGILATNYGKTTGQRWDSGDFTYDSSVDVSDLGVLATNYGAGTGVSGAAAAAMFQQDLQQVESEDPAFAAAVGARVPEPASLAMAAIGMIGLLARRRRGGHGRQG